jgi:hypothetical protein
MGKFLFNVDGVKFDVDEPSSDDSGWFTTRSESVSVDKPSFMMSAYKRDFPKGPVKNFDSLVDIISRSGTMSDWYSKTSGDYTETISIPSYGADILSPKKFKQVQEKLKLHKEAYSLEGKTIAEASATMQVAIENAKNIRMKACGELTNDPVIRVLSMNSSELPVSMQLAIIGYTAKDSNKAQDQNKYARELLYIYKRALLQRVIEDPGFKLDQFILNAAPF